MSAPAAEGPRGCPIGCDGQHTEDCVNPSCALGWHHDGDCIANPPAALPGAERDALLMAKKREYDEADRKKLGEWVQANLQHHAGKSWSEAIAAEFFELRATIEQLECRPLVLCVQRETHVAALVEAQVCDRAEAERRASARYPKGAKTNA